MISLNNFQIPLGKKSQIERINCAENSCIQLVFTRFTVTLTLYYALNYSRYSFPAFTPILFRLEKPIGSTKQHFAYKH